MGAEILDRGIEKADANPNAKEIAKFKANIVGVSPPWAMRKPKKEKRDG